jgi:formylglycine-generating enzyme required for sulfatase activity
MKPTFAFALVGYVSSLSTLITLLTFTTSAQQVPVTSLIAYEGTNSSSNIVLTWESIPTKLYNVLTTTALGPQPWQQLNASPIYSSNNLVRYRDPNNRPARFYKVVKLDTDPPEISRLYPGSNSFSVALQNPLKIWLRDETGIDPASLVLTVGTNPPATLADPRMAYANGTLTFTPATNQFLGTKGQTITNKLIVADTLGKHATNTWPFRLELATILAGNVVLITNSGPLTFLSSNDNSYVFSYTGASPGLTNGNIVVSTDPENDYKLVVVSITDNPAAHTVSIMATQALMSDIFTQGSLHFLAEDTGLDAEGFRLASETHTFTTNLGGLTIYDDNGLRFETVSGQLFFDQDYSISAEISLSAPPKVDVDLSSTLGLDLELQATYQSTLSLSPEPLRIGGPLRLVRFRGCIGTPFPPICIPFRADLVGEFNIGFESEVTGTATVTGEFQSRMELRYGSRFRDWQWNPYQEMSLPEPVVSPVSWIGTGSGRLRVYLEPKLTLYIWAAHIGSGNLKPYLELKANSCVQPGRVGAIVTAYRGISSTLALDLKRWHKDWGEQPSAELFNIRTEIWQKDFTTPIVVSTAPTPVSNMVWIPCGIFTMGSPTNEPARVAQEGPQTLVTIRYGFWMGKYEVTQRDYLTVMGSNPSWFNGIRPVYDPGCDCNRNVDYGGDLNRPVEQVSWTDAVAYCAALTTRERKAGRLPAGYVYRLPTDAEWEYACRAGTTTPFHYGRELRSGMANFNGNYEYLVGDPFLYNNPSGTYLSRTTAVGSYAPNAWGLADMHGNVWEWCSDWWSASLPGGSVTDPQGALTGSARVVRGGSWGHVARACRSAFRYLNDPGNRFHYYGFRVVLASGQP